MSESTSSEKAQPASPHESEVRVRAILNAALDCIITFDPDERIIDFNPAAEQTFGFRRKEVIGKELGELLLPEETRERGKRNIEQFLTGREGSMIGRRVETPARRRDGSEFIAEIAIQPVPLEGQLVFTIFLRDITERKQSEAKIAQVNEELKQYAEELERSNQDLDEFASVVSHDLHAPLRVIASYSQLLERSLGEDLEAEPKEFLDEIVDAARRMQGLIIDLRKFARATMGGNPRKQVSCEDALDTALANLEVEIRESGAEMTRDPLPTVMAEETQLMQLFQNLINNAIKYRGARVPKIHVACQRKDGHCLISVSDNGIGIRENFLEHIFRIFQRVDRNDKIGGSGVGLAICKRIVERNGGKIWVESTPGEGSTFHFTLPE